MNVFELIRGGDLNLVRFRIRDLSVEASEAMESDFSRVADDPADTVVDLGSVYRLSMRAVTLFARVARKLHRKGARMLICCVNEDVRWALAMGRMQKLLHTFDTLSDAMASLGRVGYRPLGTILEDRGLVKQCFIWKALEAQKGKDDPRKLGRLLVDRGELSVEDLVDALWEQFHVLIGPVELKKAA